MAGDKAVEAWLAGPVHLVPPLLQPVAHALLNAVQQVTSAIDGMTVEQIMTRPGGAASISYHVGHACGSLDRLFTYARGESLSEIQRKALEAETREDAPVSSRALADQMKRSVEIALDQLRVTDEATLLDERGVGRAKLPSTVIGLLFHGGEHTARHAGQVVTTALVIRKR